MEWKKGKVAIRRWCPHHRHSVTDVIDGWNLSSFAVNAVQNKVADPDWFAITHKPTGFNFLYFLTLDGAKIVAEYLEQNYVEYFALLVKDHKKNGQPFYDTKHIQKIMLADEPFMKLLSENAVPFSALVERKMAKQRSKFKW